MLQNQGFVTIHYGTVIVNLFFLFAWISSKHGSIDIYVKSEVSASLHSSKGMFGQRGEVELYNLLSAVNKRYLSLTYSILLNTISYRSCHSLEQKNSYQHILTIICH